jgi:hypothetical protein
MFTDLYVENGPEKGTQGVSEDIHGIGMTAWHKKLVDLIGNAKAGGIENGQGAAFCPGCNGKQTGGPECQDAHHAKGHEMKNFILESKRRARNMAWG